MGKHHLVFAIMLIATASIPAAAHIFPLSRRSQLASTVSMTARLSGSIFDIEVLVGNQTMTLQWDTGSADLWMITPDLQCLTQMTDTETLPQGSCGYGTPYYRSPTFEAVPNETFAVQYGTGDDVGTLGYDTVTLGNITISKQKIGIVNMTTDTTVGDGFISGIFGFGYPTLTSAHPASFNFTNTSFLTDKLLYKPFFVNAYEQGLVEPYFSAALDRIPVNATSGPGGYLALGSLPPVGHEPDFVSVPVEVSNAVPLELTGNVPVITLWTLTVNSTVTNKKTNTTSFQAVVDSGSPGNVYPFELAAEINAAFIPSATLLPSDTGVDTYNVDCNAIPPLHGVMIGNKTFYHQPEDMVLQTKSGQCVSSIQGIRSQRGLSLYFLGDVFMRNVVSVFDFGKNEMRFAARTDGKTPAVGYQPSRNSGAVVSRQSMLMTLSGGVLAVLCVMVHSF